MFNKFKQGILPFFSLNKSEQRGIFILAIFIVALIIINLLMPMLISNHQNNEFIKFTEDFQLFKQNQQIIRDSMSILEMQNSGQLEREFALQKIKPIAFDPNKLPEEVWLAMGFTSTQVAKIKNYEAKGGKFYRKEDVKKLYCISEAEYQIIEPYIQIKSPYQTTPERKTRKRVKAETKQLTPTNLNNANAKAIEKNLNLNPWLASRIVDYRNLLGGYRQAEQLLEVYGMKPETFQKILPFIIIDEKPQTKLNINNISFKDLLRHPYFDYESTKAIINARKKIGGFQSLDELKQIPAISDSLFNRVLPYIGIN